ncbi:M13 family metallopeptidase [Porphyromonas levii]|uniref:M13 family metallopeptidase n=1 Tax=Porphyromonas levii TaxID=28114 RepID=UPI00037EFEB4|nr:M13 family metallopeptidase [Porphyromonas levii]MBR8702481.1 Neutral endopeptidase [Porphyromonas levii]MBR8730184.1 Neutral endopeptidase [Porphyromonas levii]MBR8764326.1 Neutral endopeptidase [Porphyromonas levii]MBR8769075.1 Neutral endopeptidase [Porphyromonas levii]MBR8774596.1 Neutral endopeptidase [Porphyromonas levii]
MKKILMTLTLASMALSIGGCKEDAKKETTTVEAIPAIDLTAMDTTVMPQQDFYMYANGNWIANNPLPAGYARYGSFDMLRKNALDATKGILDEMKGNTTAGSDEEKAYKLYEMSLDTVKLDNDGAQPILAYLNEVDAIDSKDALVDYMAKSGNYGESYFFGVFVMADEKDSKNNLLQLFQPGLIMGVPDYYADNADLAKQQADYKTYVAKLFTLTGTPEADAETLASKVYDTEKSLSKIVYTMLERRDSQRNYNKMSMEELYKTFKFPYQRYFEGRNGLSAAKELNVAQKDYFHRFDKWFETTSLDDLKALIKAQILDGGANYLSKDFRDASFAFHNTSMTGVSEQKPLWQTAVSRVNDNFGDVVAQRYVAKYFPAEAKERMITLVDNLIASLGNRIDNLAWMSDATKKKAHEKLDTFIVKVGYPDKWWTYEKAELVESSLYEYMRALALFATNRNLEDLGKPVDFDRWLMNAHEVNAYYNPTTNEICFPAGILQSPFFNLNADDAVNYGGIGVVIGHEMTHGFDDQGSQYDAYGNMVNWWSEEDAKTFNMATKKLADQFDKVMIRPDLKANGQLTLGENIADQGGLLVAYDALMRATEGKEYPVIDNFTMAQRFFIGYARLWGQNITPEEETRLTKVDVHSLGKLRVNQALRNIPAFYEAFDVKEGDAMWLAPEERVIVW